ncbi:MAG TPA: hypothetical protein VHT26_08130 [Trebonia sp.]|nr:hypothetical protein [Trebonia sp.]
MPDTIRAPRMELERRLWPSDVGLACRSSPEPEPDLCVCVPSGHGLSIAWSPGHAESSPGHDGPSGQAGSSSGHDGPSGQGASGQGASGPEVRGAGSLGRGRLGLGL